ncbi:hypothetical protein [Desulfosporosinus sp. BICA1-9]|uniref:hypothetical protein n=1 Tax=Desulfosporosinus sp. BICA1-9 TaxID=1531958 RepID=UPI000A836143|nr:hypothetical protein [Desulfosporosinus sp. BICA1-9]
MNENYGVVLWIKSTWDLLWGGALFCTRLRVPPLARWTVRERVRTSGHFCM